MSFFELGIGVSGLFAAQKGLLATSNNIANAQTKGYSRQVLNQKASRPLAGMGVGMIGTGVSTISVSRVKNQYLNTKLWGQQDTLGEYAVKTAQNMMTETIFGESSESGFSQNYDSLFSSIGNIAKLPGEQERQIGLRQAAINYTRYFNSISTNLDRQQKDLNFEVKATVEKINRLATKVYSLNQQIQKSEIHGNPANVLRDEIELCIGELSKLIDIDVHISEKTDSNGLSKTEYRLSAGGQALVDGDRVRELKVVPREVKLNAEDLDNLYEVEWKDGISFSQTKCSGELKGLLDMRDGKGTDGSVPYRGVPYYKHRLDTFVRTFAQEMNKAYGEAEGYFLFAQYDVSNSHMETADYALMTAKNFCVAEAIYKDASNIRTNYEHRPDLGINPNPGNNDLLLALGEIKNKSIFVEGTPEDYMVSIFSELAINTSEAKMYQTSQTNIVRNIEMQRMSDSQVNQDEEFMSLTKYQQAYQAAAKIISTMDQIYETTIFKLGNF